MKCVKLWCYVAASEDSFFTLTLFIRECSALGRLCPGLVAESSIAINGTMEKMLCGNGVLPVFGGGDSLSDLMQRYQDAKLL